MRDRVIASALALLGTPFMHQGRSPGLAIDCAGVLVCIGRALGLVAPDFDVTGYPPTPDGVSLKRICDAMLTPAELAPGGVALIAWRFGPPQHLGVVVPMDDGLGLVHAENLRRHQVVVERLRFTRAMRLVAAYRLPGVH